ncbi:30S ribosome-binding factor RbfA [Gleimia europaea]|uniref:Ribosome-binding factor A n=1 Tax=Gleimia europaea ACS-120-V-Col10b TaxID=883069 RepID=A0A9W5RDT4_9ACTO|nr:30S ribosome-binding factor RbfA [Gleimia europaea]EPD30614.1 ribosome-binding factor A [Gleimia europaea ACS-120-V-Col10b]
MADINRQRKVEDRIQQTVARLLERRIKDPRLGFVTVTDVRVTGDLQHATIFYTVLGSADEAAKSAKALESAKGLIRSEVGKALGIRLTPTIDFQADSLPQAAASIEDALLRARKADEKLAQVAKNAEYAGGEDPYKRAEEE